MEKCCENMELDASGRCVMCSTQVKKVETKEEKKKK